MDLNFIRKSIRAKLLLPVSAALFVCIFSLALFNIVIQERLQQDMHQSTAALLLESQQLANSQLHQVNYDIEKSLTKLAATAGQHLSQVTEGKLRKEKQEVAQAYESTLHEGAETIAKLMAKVAPASILSYDYLSLIGLSKAVSESPDIVFALFMNKNGKPMTRYLDRENPLIKKFIANGQGKKQVDKLLDAAMKDNSVFLHEQAIELEGQLLGKIILCISKIELNNRIGEMSVRFAALVDANKEMVSATLTNESSKVKDKLNQLINSLTSESGKSARATGVNISAFNKKISSSTRNSILIGGAVSILLGFFIIDWIIRFAINSPVQELNRASQKISSGHLDTRAEYDSEDELGNLAKAFNGMTAQLGRTMAGLEQQIAERKRAEEEVRKHRDHLEDLVNERTAELAVAKEEAEEATKAKSSFLARMSHEIRKPMNAIIGLTNLALKTELNTVQQDYLLKVDESSRHLLHIINDILDFSKIEAGKLELEHTDFMLHHVIEKMANMFRIKAAEKGIELFYVIDAKVPLSLKGDPLRLGQILINLMSNSVKFTDQGEIIVKVEPDLENTPAKPQLVNLLFSIQDSGIGIRQDQLETLFLPFTQTDGSVTRKYGGTGLGLSICHRLVSLMGGKIWGESELGRGSTFYIALSLERGTEENQHVLVSPQDLRGMKALVVDDNETSRHILTEMLSNFDFQVTVSASGTEALAELESGALERPYELVIVDWKMPEMDGFELAEQIRDHSLLGGKTVSPKIIMVTMYGREEFIREQKKRETGINGYLLKPVSSSELFNAVMEVFNREEAMVPRISFAQESKDLVSVESIKGARLLLVEDNAINQQVADMILQRVGFIVEVAENGKEAVDILKAEAERNGPFFDAVLMDIQMPVMDGYVATQVIRRDSRFTDLPIIAMTAHAMKGDREKCLEAGMNDYVAKPIDERELFNALIKWVKPGKRDIAEEALHRKEYEEEPWEKMPARIPGIDLEAGLGRIHGNSGLYKKLLRGFLERFAKSDALINGYVKDGQRREAKALAHGIKGAAGNIGADDLFRAARELEQTLGEKKAAGLEERLATYADTLSSLISSLRDLQLEEDIAETNHEEIDEVEVGKAAPIIGEMLGLLEKNNSRVRHCLPALKKTLHGTAYQEQLHLLDRAIYNLDSEKAVAILVEIARKLDIPLAEEKES